MRDGKCNIPWFCQIYLFKPTEILDFPGPWHSDSGLDRNIDPQEDSYVKKVIASNEGLNFNKDMAEAGGTSSFSLLSFFLFAYLDTVASYQGWKIKRTTAPMVLENVWPSE